MKTSPATDKGRFVGQTPTSYGLLTKTDEMSAVPSATSATASAVKAGRRTSDRAAFTNDIARVSLNYQVTRELSVRPILDYNHAAPDVRRITLAHDERLGLDTLITYHLGPATALHLGYTAGFQNLLANDEGVPATRIDMPSTWWAGRF